MRKQVTIETIFCDVTGCEEKANKYARCLRCGAEHCLPHANELCVSYAVSARPFDFINSRVARYCKRCDINLHESGDDPLYNALTQTRTLAEQYERFVSDYDRASAQANETLRPLLPEEFRFFVPPQRKGRSSAGSGNNSDSLAGSIPS